MTSPKVSVVVPTYNCAAYLKQALDSVLAQSYQDFEIILVDDASTDGTAALLKEYQSDEKIKILRNSENHGVSFSRNLALKESQGEWVAFLDSDDFWDRDKLLLQIGHLAKESADFSCTGVHWIKEGSKKTGTLIPKPAEVTYSELLKQNVITLSSVMVRRALLPYPEAFENRGNEDYALWLRLLLKTHCSVLAQPLASYRIRKNSRSSQKLKSAQNNWRIYREIAGLSRAKSTYYLGQFALRSLRKYLSFLG